MIGAIGNIGFLYISLYGVSFFGVGLFGVNLLAGWDLVSPVSPCYLCISPYLMFVLLLCFLSDLSGLINVNVHCLMIFLKGLVLLPPTLLHSCSSFHDKGWALKCDQKSSKKLRFSIIICVWSQMLWSFKAYFIDIVDVRHYIHFDTIMQKKKKKISYI